MALLQGNTYELPIQLKDSNGDLVSNENVVKGQFIFGKIEKYYGLNGEVQYNEEKKAFIVPLTEEDTFNLKGSIQWQVRLSYTNGSINGTLPKTENIYNSITQTRLGV